MPTPVRIPRLSQRKATYLASLTPAERDAAIDRLERERGGSDLNASNAFLLAELNYLLGLQRSKAPAVPLDPTDFGGYSRSK